MIHTVVDDLFFVMEDFSAYKIRENQLVALHKSGIWITLVHGSYEECVNEAHKIYLLLCLPLPEAWKGVADNANFFRCIRKFLVKHNIKSKEQLREKKNELEEEMLVSPEEILDWVDYLP